MNSIIPCTKNRTWFEAFLRAFKKT